jgi:hypothetical protein
MSESLRALASPASLTAGAAGRPQTHPSTLNPPPPPSPSCSAMIADEVLDWLLFSPSSSEGHSGRPSSISPASIVDVVHSRLAPQQPSPLPQKPTTGRREGKAPMSKGGPSLPPFSRFRRWRIQGCCPSRILGIAATTGRACGQQRLAGRSTPSSVAQGTSVGLPHVSSPAGAHGLGRPLL